MRATRGIGMLMGGILAAAAGLAAAQDVPGSADHPLVGRYEGATITFHETRAYDEVRLPDRVKPRGADEDGEGWSRELAGTVTAIGYEGPGGRTLLEVVRNLQAALEAKGFAEVFFCQGEDCVERGGLPDFWALARGEVRLPTTWASTVYLLAEREDAEGHATVAIMGVETRASGSRPVTAQLAVTVVEAAAMETDRVTFVEASAMGEAIDRDGRIAIYGIHFDFDSAALQPASDPQLAELAALMAARPGLEAIVVGHTDGQGAFDYNLALSQRRAQAVVDALVGRHGVARDRLTPAGAGMVAPVARNNTEDGRALNRRVEIVELWRE